MATQVTSAHLPFDLSPIRGLRYTQRHVCHRHGNHPFKMARVCRPVVLLATLPGQSRAACTVATSTTQTAAAQSSMTQRIFEEVDKLNATSQAGGAGGRTTYQSFLAVDDIWQQLRNMPEGAAAGPAPRFVQQSSGPLPSQPQYDVVVCGGTLGVFAAAALAKRGLKVAVVERGPLRGREQEWNISRKELMELSEVGIATEEELEACVRMEFNPVRVGFHGGKDVWTTDVLNLGVSPVQLIELMKAKLKAFGGDILENVGLEGVTVHPNGCSLQTKSSSAQTLITTRLVVDCMGHFSPIVKQMRWGRKPDGICLVVGTLGSGFKDNKTADVIFTNTPLQPADARVNRLQYFWEAFPAGSGPEDRTTYMFTYMDAQSWRPSLADVFEDYWQLMPQYQGVKLEDITFKRVLFGFFPTFRDTPLQPGFDRIIQIGDASGIQSPLSFGGFGALTRHLRRITTALSEALEADALDKENLGLIHAYNPGLSSSWMMQRAMSAREFGRPSPDLINRMLSGNFQAMQQLGDPVMKPFLQDVIKFGPMAQTMGAQMVNDPLSIPQLIMHVGPGPLIDWTKHMVNLGAYTVLHQTVGQTYKAFSQKLPPKPRYRLCRLLDAWEYGSGADYQL